MKKVFIAAPLFLLIACNDNNKSTTLPNSDPAMATNADTQISDHTYVKRVYSPAEGDIIYREKKINVWKNGAYVEADNDVTLDNGIIVKRNGEVSRKDKTVKLEEGEVVSKTGEFFNSVGEKIEDGWDATKRGVKKAAAEVEKAAEKTGEKVNDAVN